MGIAVVVDGRLMRTENVQTKIVINMDHLINKIIIGMFFSLLAMGMTSCAIERCCPDHIGLRSGVDFEVQEGTKPKVKPGVHACVDWNL